MNRYEYRLPFIQGQKIVEFGGGENPRFRPNVDSRPLPTVDLVLDMNGDMSEVVQRYQDLDGVFSSYMLEHVSWRNVRNVLSAMHTILRPGGRLVLVVPNLVEQARHILRKDALGEFGDNEVCCVFGDQTYRENAHAAGWSPDYMIRVLREIGFSSVFVFVHPATDTDMIVEARKPETVDAGTDVDRWTERQRVEAYGHDYFNGGGKFGGYSREGYWDYPVHAVTAAKVLEERPHSVLELGPARGYVLKRISDAGIPVVGLEVSRHCVRTRVVENIIPFDITAGRWPLNDDSVDLCVSNAVLEHIPERHLPHVFAEMTRVSRRGMHGISFADTDDGFDRTHCTLRDRAWWEKKLPQGQRVVDQRELETGTVTYQPDNAIKLNLGSHLTMFGYGWVNIDVGDLDAFAQRHGFNYRRLDVTQGLPYADRSVSMIFSSHMLEHLSPSDGLNLLRECRRVLAPDGLVRLVLPDTRKIAALYMDGGLPGLMEDLAPQTGAEHLRGSNVGAFWHLLVSAHACAYDEDSLLAVARSAGFDRCAVMGFRRSASHKMLVETQESLPDISMYVELMSG